MAQFKLLSVEMNDTIFVGGRNMPSKLTEQYCKDQMIELYYDLSPNDIPVPQLAIVYKGLASFHPYTMVKGYQAVNPEDAGMNMKLLKIATAPLAPPPPPHKPIKAQVSAPNGIKI